MWLSSSHASQAAWFSNRRIGMEPEESDGGAEGVEPRDETLRGWFLVLAVDLFAFLIVMSVSTKRPLDGVTSGRFGVGDRTVRGRRRSVELCRT